MQIYRADGRCLLSNRAFLDLFGKQPAHDYNLLGDRLAERCGLRGMFQRALEGETVRAPRVWCDPSARACEGPTNGHRKAVSVSLFPLVSKDGSVDHVAAVFRDETAQALAHEHAQASERLFRQLVEDSIDLVFVKDQKGRYVIANPASAQVVGRTVADTVGRTDDEIFPPEVARTLREIDRRIVASGTAETYDETFTVDGDVRHYSTAKIPWRDEEGTPRGIIGISRNITDRKRSEAALAKLAVENRSLFARTRADERWLETILESTPTPLIFIEPETARLFFANTAADRFAGGVVARPASAADYPRLLDMRDLDDRPFGADDNPLVRAARGERLDGVHVRWHLPAGVRVVAMQSVRLAAVYGHAETILVAFDDITALKDVQTALEEAVRVREDFLSIAGHELKTPLTALFLVVRSLDRALSQERPGLARDGEASSLLGTDARLAERWQTIQRQIRRLNGLVDQLLDVSRLAAGKLTFESEPLDLVEVAREVAGRFQIPGAGTTEATPITVDAPGPVRGLWDRLRVEQVITNLVSNAVKYGEGRPVTITIRAPADAATLAVQDRGIGIAPEALGRIFDRFERAASARQYGGLGLGLWIVRQLVEAMGGDVSVESALGHGSTFTLRLPRHAAAD